MSPANLVQTAWLPVRRVSGRGVIKPPELTTALATNPIIDLDWLRADFRFACLEMLIGLLATACPPADEDEWQAWWRKPPSPEVLEAKFAPIASAFVLDGDGPRFCQDLEDFPGDSLPVERLLIDAPGEKTVRRNADLLVKRDRVMLLGRPAAAMALYTLQAFAPSGGAGHRTSLRGGGPLTTLVRPPQQDDSVCTLWHLLWANVPSAEAPNAKDLPKVFPWLAPTRRSEGDIGTELGSAQAHALQAFWGMPRRIRLDVRAALPGEVCGVTGEPDSVVVTGFRARPWGVQYADGAIAHPLSPTYVPKLGTKPLAVHPQRDGIGYRHWHQFVGSIDPDKRYKAAATVETFIQRKPLSSAGNIWVEARLLIGGYDMDNMKARSFIEAEMPFFVIENADLRRDFLELSRSLAQGATEAANMLRSAIRNALDIDDNDRATVDDAWQRFFELTAGAFWTTLRDTIDDRTFRSHNVTAREAVWKTAARRCLRDEACAVFDAVAPLDPLAPDAAGAMHGGQWKPSPVVGARRNLGRGLAGYGNAGEALFRIFGLEGPDKKPSNPKPERPKKGEAALHG
jgi:CRISPR system Cascade subunit CasA